MALTLASQPAKAVNATLIDLEEAAAGYRDFDKGAAKKFVLDPHGIARKHLGKGGKATKGAKAGKGAGKA